ncbi:putative pentatricopeptide [Rosa chinensis]|uniref:Putative pentatricopeptide n=1 Tax=Rosa chinensis TaxID=74649 RepID=A0A2P6QLK0_ROSCH|nr:putative pentatricopeptide [Rosa chinensis]
MLLCGIVPNDYTLSIIINCYCRLNQMGFSLSVLGSFFKWGLQPNVFTFNTLINGFVLQNRVDEAALVFRKMVEAGHCKPDETTLIGKMEERGCEPDIFTYSTIIIHSLCKDTLIDEALTLFSEMISRGIAPDVVTYTSLIQGDCNIGHWKKATRLLNEMLSKGIFPNVFTFNVLVDTFCKEGMVVEAESGSMVDVQSYRILINGYCKARNINKAYKIFKEMHRMELVPDTITYSTLIDGFCKAGRLQEAEKLFSEMLGCGQLPDVETYAVILDGLCNNQQLSTAVEFLREMEANKIELDNVVYTLVIEVIEAEKLLREMGGKGCSPDGCTYNTIIRGLLNNSKTSWAMKFIQEMVELGFSADASTMELIVGLLSKDIVDPSLLPLFKGS